APFGRHEEMMNEYQTKRVLSNRTQDAESGKFGGKTRASSNRFQTLPFPETDDYEESFPSLSGSYSKTQKEPSSQDQLFIDAVEVNTSLRKMVNDLPLDSCSRRFGSAAVKSFEEDVKGAPFDSVRRVSLEELIYCLKGLSPFQIAEGLNLTFCPSTSSRDAVPLVSGQPVEDPGVERNVPAIVEEVIVVTWWESKEMNVLKKPKPKSALIGKCYLTRRKRM
ncbi:hypothetical protein U1Q18_015346, partial [Sarracenia purpurea var. burkii]